MNYTALIFEGVFGENVVLALFLGLCPFIAQSKRVDSAVGLGSAVVVVMGIATPFNWLIWNFLLKPQALSSSIDLSFMRFIVFIATIAALVHILEKVIKRFSQSLYQQLGIYLPLITVNCAVLGTSLFTIERGHTFIESVIFGTSSALGWALACVILATVRHKIRASNVPKNLQGTGIAFILTGLMAMAFSAFNGLV